MSQNNALINVSARNYIVASVDKDGLFSMSSRPMFHNSLDSAMKECARLAEAAPGKAYVACHFSGGALVPSGTVTF